MTAEPRPEREYHCDACADMGCAKCSPEWALAHHTAAAIDRIVEPQLRLPVGWRVVYEGIRPSYGSYTLLDESGKVIGGYGVSIHEGRRTWLFDGTWASEQECVDLLIARAGR